MTWATLTKAIAVSKTVPHPNTDPNVIGRAPGVTTISFTPFEMFGAAARTSYLHAINPHVVTPESLMISALLEQHVDDVNPDFALLATASRFKDYAKSYFVGTVAAGIAYLTCVQDGYVWSDHFENLTGGNPASKKSPDYVFARPGSGIALLESKGTRSAKLATFDVTVRDGYRDQVEPHLGHPIGGLTATHGYCVGSYLTSTSTAELRIHHTEVPAIGQAQSSAGQGLSLVQRHNYATALTLAHSPGLGLALRGGTRSRRVRMIRFRWLGRNWLTGAAVFGPREWIVRRMFLPDLETWWDSPSGSDFPIFAIEEGIAKTALSRFLDRDRIEPEADNPDFEPLDPQLIAQARNGRDAAGAIFPDGLALLRLKEAADLEIVTWNPQSRRLERN